MSAKSEREKIGMGFTPKLIFRMSLCLPILARFHDEATTGDYGSDTGDQFNIVAGADEHPEKDHNGQESYSKKGACRKSYGPRDTGTARADAKPAGSDRRAETTERR